MSVVFFCEAGLFVVILVMPCVVSCVVMVSGVFQSVMVCGF